MRDIKVQSAEILNVQIRSFVESDMEGLRSLWRTSWIATYAPILGEDFPRFSVMLEEPALTSMIPRTDETVLLAVAGDNIIGSVIFAKRQIGVVWGMYVLPSHQRSGVGTSLLRGVARQLDGTDVVMVVVLKSSVSAISFYERLGFVPGEDTDFEMVPGRKQAAMFMYARLEKLKGVAC